MAQENHSEFIYTVEPTKFTGSLVLQHDSVAVQKCGFEHSFPFSFSSASSLRKELPSMSDTAPKIFILAILVTMVVVTSVVVYQLVVSMLKM